MYSSVCVLISVKFDRTPVAQETWLLMQISAKAILLKKLKSLLFSDIGNTLLSAQISNLDS
ncbi:hypothetical protein TUM4445_16040 [Shewanella sp. MBTL60-112-B2]|nr:hypothetical protein TUM4444_19570 [Shewanella sp. MBTL60-112-B1]GIU31511.1 hypothetical protein TUM4445_16040 [Shewanella sp. MBTL60-112-B2]